jgi:type I site-specific restriction endonuclease
LTNRRITEIASLLEELSNVPMVAAEMALILEVQTDEFWEDITLPMLETMRRRLRSLVKPIEYKRRTLVYSAFEDSASAAAILVCQAFLSERIWRPSDARRISFSSRMKITLQC